MLSTYTLFQSHVDYPPWDGLTCPQETLDRWRFESHHKALANLHALMSRRVQLGEPEKDRAIKGGWLLEIKCLSDKLKGWVEEMDCIHNSFENIEED